MKNFKKEVTHILDPNGMWKDKLTSAPITDLNGEGTRDDESKKRHDYFWFVHSADELLGDVENQIGELEGLKKSAESTSTSVRQ